MHGVAADTPPPSTPAVGRRLADQDGTISGNNSTVDDDARRACLALIGPVHPACERDLSAAPYSLLRLPPRGSRAAHATKWSTSREQRRVISRERRSTRRIWMFAALNTIEGRVQQRAEIDLFHAEQPWARERRPVVVDAVRMRLGGARRQLFSPPAVTEGWRAW